MISRLFFRERYGDSDIYMTPGSNFNLRTYGTVPAIVMTTWIDLGTRGDGRPVCQNSANIICGIYMTANDMCEHPSILGQACIYFWMPVHTDAPAVAMQK